MIRQVKLLGLLLLLGAHATLAFMARGRGRGQKLVIQKDFVVAEGDRSVIIHDDFHEEKELRDQSEMEE